MTQPYIAATTWSDGFGHNVGIGVTMVVGNNEADAQAQALRVAMESLPGNVVIDKPFVDVMDRPVILWHEPTDTFYLCRVIMQPVTPQQIAQLREPVKR